MDTTRSLLAAAEPGATCMRLLAAPCVPLNEQTFLSMHKIQHIPDTVVTTVHALLRCLLSQMQNSHTLRLWDFELTRYSMILPFIADV